MLRIEQIEDKDALKQAALLLDRENQRLHQKVIALTQEIARLKGTDASTAQLQLAFLKELLAKREQALFGDKSERRIGDCWRSSSQNDAGQNDETVASK